MVPAGRLFLRRLIDLSTTARKLYYHVTLNAEARADIKWWEDFLPSWNGVAMFLDPEWTAADSLQLFMDASGSLGFGAYFKGAWLRGDWHPHQCLPLRSIQWQELFAIVATASTWGHHWSGLRIHFHCDTLPTVQAWARQSSKHPDLMQLLRTLFLVAAQHNFTIRMSHLPGTKETITLFAAHLSRSLNSRTIHVYVAAVSFLHHSLGYRSPASKNPMLRLAIRGVQHLQRPIHLRPTRLPLTPDMLGHMLQRLKKGPQGKHDI